MVALFRPGPMEWINDFIAAKNNPRQIKYPHPDYVNDVLAHAYEKNGQIEKAIEQWEYVRDNYSTFRNIAIRMLHDLKAKGKATP